ncbi:MAG: ABC transporter substrate-binding protein [Xanthobacteraceae bacterium]|nr:ABC transporter substrate-binding protein [Xanthobacteraceae bacterium]
MATYHYDKHRRRLTRRDLVKGGFAVTAIAAVGPYYLRYAHAQTGPIKIGLPVPLTGPYSSEAQNQARCAQLAIDMFNQAGGLKGRMAELLVRDDKLNPGEAATRSQELIESDKVNFLCGSLSASVQLAVNNVAKNRGVIYNSISQSDTINEASDFSKYTFHEALNPHMTSGAVGRYVFPKFGKRVAFLTADYAYGHEMVNGFKRVGKQFGLEDVLEIKHPIGQADYSTFFPRIQAAKPDILIASNFGRDQLNTFKQATEFGLKQQMKIICPVLLYTQRLAGGGTSFEGVIGGANYYWELEKTAPTAKRLNDAYRAKHGGEVPSDYAAYGFSGIYSMLEAVKKVGTTDTDAVIAAMETLKYDAYKGTQYFRKCDHQSVQSVLVIESKPDSQAKSKADICSIVATETGSEDRLRSCKELGHG